MRSSSRRVPTGHPRAAGPRTQRGQIELSGGRHGAAPRPLGPSGSTNDSTRGGRHVWARRGAAGRWPSGLQASRAPPSGASAHGRFLRGPFLGPFEALSPSRPCLFCSILLGNGLLLLFFFLSLPVRMSALRGQRFLFYSLLYSEPLEWCVAHSRCSINAERVTMTCHPVARSIQTRIQCGSQQVVSGFAEQRARLPRCGTVAVNEIVSSGSRALFSVGGDRYTPSAVFLVSSVAKGEISSFYIAE